MPVTTPWTANRAASLLDDVAHAVIGALDGVKDWGPSGLRPTQYRSDVAADAAALGVLDRVGVGVLSEESGLRRAEHPLLVVVDPLDGSTNASLGLPWFATSLCAVDADGPLVALVVNLATGERFTARRGEGAFCDSDRLRVRSGRAAGLPLQPSGCTQLSESILHLSGLPPRHLGWQQFRVYGAAALDLCSVAAGVIDGFIDCSVDAHGVWDYLGGLLICEEAGAVVADAHGRDLLIRDPSLRRTPVAGATSSLLTSLVKARQSFG